LHTNEDVSHCTVNVATRAQTVSITAENVFQVGKNVYWSLC